MQFINMCGRGVVLVPNEAMDLVLCVCNRRRYWPTGGLILKDIDHSRTVSQKVAVPQGNRIGCSESAGKWTSLKQLSQRSYQDRVKQLNLFNYILLSCCCSWPVLNPLTMSLVFLFCLLGPSSCVSAMVATLPLETSNVLLGCRRTFCCRVLRHTTIKKVTTARRPLQLPILLKVDMAGTR